MRRWLQLIFVLLAVTGCRAATGTWAPPIASATTCAPLDWAACDQMRGCGSGSRTDADGTRVFKCIPRYSEYGSAQNAGTLLPALAAQPAGGGVPR